jgi:hypothetical protein
LRDFDEDLPGGSHIRVAHGVEGVRHGSLDRST